MPYYTVANLVTVTKTSMIDEMACGNGTLGTTMSNNFSSFCQKHPGVPNGSNGSDGSLYLLTENYTLPAAQATGPSLLD
jgi:hypothetical protein